MTNTLLFYGAAEKINPAKVLLKRAFDSRDKKKFFHDVFCKLILDPENIL